MPRASDFCTIAIKSNPVPTKTNPLGVKGAGEAGTVGAMPAVANVLVDAFSKFGVRHIEMPAPAEVIWRATGSGKRVTAGGGSVGSECGRNNRQFSSFPSRGPA
jgi:carbon-monoxide dehydrogenase large subunit